MQTRNIAARRRPEDHRIGSVVERWNNVRRDLAEAIARINLRRKDLPKIVLLEWHDDLGIRTRGIDGSGVRVRTRHPRRSPSPRTLPGP